MGAQWVTLFTTLAQVQAGLFIAFAVVVSGLRLVGPDGWFLRLTGFLAMGTLLGSVLMLFWDALGMAVPTPVLIAIAFYGMSSMSVMVGAMLPPISKRRASAIVEKGQGKVGRSAPVPVEDDKRAVDPADADGHADGGVDDEPGRGADDHHTEVV